MYKELLRNPLDQIDEITVNRKDILQFNTDSDQPIDGSIDHSQGNLKC